MKRGRICFPARAETRDCAGRPYAAARVRNVAVRAPFALRSLGSHPTRQAGAQKAEVFGREKHGFFSARFRTPFRENAPVKFYFPLQTTFHAAKN